MPEKNRTPVIALDLDGTIAQYDKFEGVDVIGDPIEGAQDFVDKLSKLGEVIIYTTRMNPDMDNKYTQDELFDIIKSWMNKHKFPDVEIYIGQGKPLADVYVDDRAFNLNPGKESNTIDAYEEALERLPLYIETNESVTNMLDHLYIL